MKNTVRRITLIAIFAALMCVLSPLSIPIAPVPISLATLVVYLIAAVFPVSIAPCIVLLYLVIGLCGVPVFAGFKAGLDVFLGPTGGFLWGYLLGAVAESLFVTSFKGRKWSYPLGMFFATVLIYLCGVLWFLYSMHGSYDLKGALMACVVPFLLGDAVKIAVATAIAIPLRRFSDQQIAVKAR